MSATAVITDFIGLLQPLPSVDCFSSDHLLISSWVSDALRNRTFRGCFESPALLHWLSGPVCWKCKLILILVCQRKWNLSPLCKVYSVSQKWGRITFGLFVVCSWLHPWFPASGQRETQVVLLPCASSFTGRFISGGTLLFWKRVTHLWGTVNSKARKRSISQGFIIFNSLCFARIPNYFYFFITP